jgi:hypothetical protein
MSGYAPWLIISASRSPETNRPNSLTAETAEGIILMTISAILPGKAGLVVNKYMNLQKNQIKEQATAETPVQAAILCGGLGTRITYFKEFQSLHGCGNLFTSESLSSLKKALSISECAGRFDTLFTALSTTAKPASR